MALGLSQWHSRPEVVIPGKGPAGAGRGPPARGAVGVMTCLHACGWPSIHSSALGTLGAMPPHVFKGTCQARGATDGQFMGGRGPGPTYQGTHTSQPAPHPQRATKRGRDGKKDTPKTLVMCGVGESSPCSVRTSSGKQPRLRALDAPHGMEIAFRAESLCPEQWLMIATEQVKSSQLLDSAKRTEAPNSVF